MLNSFRANWLNCILAVFLAIASAFAMNWRDWHPDVFTGRSLAGFGLLAVGALIVGILVVLSFRDRPSRWARQALVFGAFSLGLAVGVGGLLFFQNADISWKEALAGLGAFAVIGGLITGITVTTWLPGRRP